MTPTQLSLRHLRTQGYTAEKVEYWDAFAQKRHDLWGFVDVLAIRPGEVLAVQTTSSDNVSARVRKIAEHPNVAAVREAGIAIHVHGWRKDEKKRRWVLRTVDVS